MSIITDLQNLCGFAGAGGYGASAGERVSLRGGITAAAISRGNLLFCLQGQEDTLRRHYFDRSERCPKFLAFLETLAECKTYRGFAPASPNPAGSLSSTQSKRKSTPYGVLFLFGRGRRIRTRDPRFWRPVLYQLSYTPVCFFNLFIIVILF